MTLRGTPDNVNTTMMSRNQSISSTIRAGIDSFKVTANICAGTNVNENPYTTDRLIVEYFLICDTSFGALLLIMPIELAVSNAE